MNRATANALYEENFWVDYVSMEDTLLRIGNLARAGGYNLAIRIDSSELYRSAWEQLESLGYDVYDYDFRYKDILHVKWG